MSMKSLFTALAIGLGGLTLSGCVADVGPYGPSGVYYGSAVVYDSRPSYRYGRYYGPRYRDYRPRDYYRGPPRYVRGDRYYRGRYGPRPYYRYDRY